MITVLFACVHNAGRSQMAAAWFNALADPAKARARSAGTHPGSHVHPSVVEAMREAGPEIERAMNEAMAALHEIAVPHIMPMPVPMPNPLPMPRPLPRR